MFISLRCPGCSKKLKIKDGMAGDSLECPVCAKVFEIPTQASNSGAHELPAVQRHRKPGRLPWVLTGVSVLLLVGGFVIWWASSNLASARAEIDSLKAELAKANAKATLPKGNAELQTGELTKSKAETESLMAELAKTKAEADKTRVDLAKAKVDAETLKNELTKAKNDLAKNELAKAKTDMAKKDTAVLVQPDDDPAKVMKAMEEKIAKADTLHLDIDGNLFELLDLLGDGAGTNPVATFTANMVAVAAGNKARFEISHNVMGNSIKVISVDDGGKNVTSIGGKIKETTGSTKFGLAAVVVTVARTGLYGKPINTRKEADVGKEGPDEVKESPLETVKMSNIKKLKTEKVGGRDALVIEYKLTFKDQDFSFKARVWIDTETNLPLKRVLRAEQFSPYMTITETYSNFRINPMLDDNLFKFPK